MAGKPVKRYTMTGPGEVAAGDYARVVRVLNDAELEEEILSGAGEPGYRAALIREADRRGQSPPGEE